MSQLELLHDIWNVCSKDEREQFLQLIATDPTDPTDPTDQAIPAEEEVKPVQEDPPEQCALCLSDIADERVNPYSCEHEFCSECYDSNKYNDCMSNCPLCRADLTLQLEQEVTGLIQYLKQYILICESYRSARSKKTCEVQDILFNNVDILQQFRLISTSPVNFMTRDITVPDGGTNWESGVYTSTSVNTDYTEGVIGETTYVQRYIFVNRRSKTYIKYCVLFETVNLEFTGRHLKSQETTGGYYSESFNGKTSASYHKFIRTDWNKVCDIDLSNSHNEYADFLAKPITRQSIIDFQVGYTELEEYFAAQGQQLHCKIALYISIAHDLLIYDSMCSNYLCIPFTFLGYTLPQSAEDTIFIKQPHMENPIHNILRTRSF